jgi:hypothetical protein
MYRLGSGACAQQSPDPLHASYRFLRSGISLLFPSLEFADEWIKIDALHPVDALLKGSD